MSSYLFILQFRRIKFLNALFEEIDQAWKHFSHSLNSTHLKIINLYFLLKSNQVTKPLTIGFLWPKKICSKKVTIMWVKWEVISLELIMLFMIMVTTLKTFRIRADLERFLAKCIIKTNSWCVIQVQKR